jgi:diketogulonate reductase-like aldo/keto reductase
MRTVTLPGGETVPALGQGTWHMGEGHMGEGHMGEGSGRHAEEAAALRLGIELGLTLIDTAEMYADGGAEEVVAEAIAGQRDRVFIVSKVYPHNASKRGVPAACEASLRRLKTDRIDLYLLHWRGSTPLAETVAAFRDLQAAGKIRHWGVSNFDVDDMEELAALGGGGAGCAANQVLYHLDARGIEFDLLPWSERHGIPIMAYSPVGQAGRLLRSPALRRVAERHGATPAQIAIAWTLRHPVPKIGGVISIPKAADPAHVRQNAAAADIVLSPADLAELDAAHQPPQKKRPLAML